MEYELKIWPEPFEAVLRGKKTAEFRNWQDKKSPPKAGDSLTLREWKPVIAFGKPQKAGSYTGNKINKLKVSYVIDCEKWAPESKDLFVICFEGKPNYRTIRNKEENGFYWAMDDEGEETTIRIDGGHFFPIGYTQGLSIKLLKDRFLFLCPIEKPEGIGE